MPDPIRKVNPGEPFVPSAKLTNALVDLLALDLSTSSGKITATKSQTVLSIKNSSGHDRNRMEVLALGEPWITPTENLDEFATKPSFESVLPDDEAYLGRFVVLLDPIGDGQTGRAAIAGAVPALVLKPEGDAAPAAVDVLGYSPTQVGALAFLHPKSAGGAEVLWIEPDEDATAWEGDAELGDVWVGYLLHRAIVRFGRGPAGQVAIFEMKTTLREGGADAIGWKVEPSSGHFPGANDAGSLDTYTIRSRIQYGTAPVHCLPTFRGIAYGQDDVQPLLDCSPDDGRTGDLVLATEIDGVWYAVGNGRIHGRAVVQGLATDESVGPGGTVIIDVVEGNRGIQCVGEFTTVDESTRFTDTATIHCGTAKNGSRLELWWDHQAAPPRWKADVCAKQPPPDEPPDDDEDEDEDGDDDSGDGGDGVGSPGGDGSSGSGGNCSACSGLPDGEKCLPTECCSDDETAPVTDCESANPAYTSYKFEIEGSLCIPQAVKDAATVTRTSGCTWESAPVTADDPLTGEVAEWQWRFEPAKEGTSWLRLYKDGEVFLQFFRAGPWCYRCAQVFEVFCPPSDCSDISARVCVRPICVDACEHSTTYEITSPGDEDAADSTVYVIDGDNAAEVTTTQDFGCPDPPARSTIFTYGTTASVADGAVAIDIFPETEYSPTTCGSALDFVNADVKARVIFDDTVDKLGVKYGVAVEQDGKHFVAVMGDVHFDPQSDACTYLGRQHLKAEDFILVDGSGFDSASHPDFSATAPDMRFGIARWVMDNADGDDPAAPGHKAGTIYDNAHIQLCYAPCDGDAPAFDCPTSVNLATCVGGDVVSETITITNNGDNPFNVTGWSRTSGLNPALNPTVSPFPLAIAADPPGSLAPGAEWEMTFTLTPGDAAWTGSGYVTIHTTIGPCTFPVTATVLEDCDADDPCALFHDDTRDYEANPGPNVTAGTALSDLVAANDFEPYNGGLLSYSATLLECDTTDGSIETAEAVENETRSGGGAQFNSGANLSASRAVIQLIDGVPANYALKAVCEADLSGSPPNHTHAIGIAFGVKAANDWWAVVSTKFMLGGPSFSGFALLRQAPGAALSIVDNYFTGSSTGMMVCGIHVLGNRAKIALEDGVTVASASLLDSSQVDKVFAEQQLAGTGVGLLRTNGEPTAKGANGSYWGELCITDRPGLVPPWEVDPP